MAQRLDHEPDMTLELITNSAAGIWQSPIVSDKCCIYRVPHRLRRVNPEAYTPQLVLIGPLHYSLKSEAIKSLGGLTNEKLVGYLNMEKHKRFYLTKFAQRFDGERTIEEFKRIIQENEEDIRASYSESTSWIKSPEFVNMILFDSVFILEFILRTLLGGEDEDRILVNVPLHQTVFLDLILLENQLPFFILEKLFDPMLSRLSVNETLLFRNVIIDFFRADLYIDEKFQGVGSMIKHFTDLLRCARVDTLGPKTPAETTSQHFGFTKTRGSRESKNKLYIEHMYNVEKLYSAGMKFVTVKKEVSINVTFKNGCLTIPEMWIIDETEIILRNIMALEQCHYTSNTHVCDFVTFLDFLIDSDKDVDLLIEKGILNNWIGEQRAVAEMVNKLRLGIVDCDANYYSDVACEVNAYYENPFNRTRAVLSRMYFSNLWRGTATIAAVLLLVMTLIQTVGSVIQVMPK